MRIDEINNLVEETCKAIEGMISEDMTDEKIGEVKDSILDLLILSYVYGTDDADFILGSAKPPDMDKMQSALYKKIAGKDWIARVEANLKKPTIIPVITPEGDTYGNIKRIIETETHRVYNNAVIDRGRESDEEVYKTWKTMTDDKVREAHFYLNDMSIPLEERFYTYDGYSALYPGDFGHPDLDVNCRCYIQLTRQGSL